LLGGLTLIAVNQQWIEKAPSFFYQTLIFLVFATSTIFTYLYKAKSPDYFVQLYLLTMAVKFLAYGAYNVLMILEDKDGASYNVVFFMVLYIIFTGLEIAVLFRKITGSRHR
jgi:hypothetical protein